MNGGAMRVRDLAEYLDAIRRRYVVATKRGKGQLLDEVCQTLGCHRKSAIRMVRRGLQEAAGATRRGEGQLLTGVCRTLACHRKSAIRMVRRGLQEPTSGRRRGRPR